MNKLIIPEYGVQGEELTAGRSRTFWARLGAFRNRHPWLQRGIFVALAWCFLLVLIDRAGLGDLVEAQLEHRLLFKLRDAFGQSVVLSDKLVVYALDDSTAARLQRPDLKEREWYYLLRNIQASKPRAIIIPKMFSLVVNYGAADYWLGRIAELNAPTVVAAHVRPELLRERKPLTNAPGELELLEWYPASLAGTAKAPELLPGASHQWHVYGPDAIVLDQRAFRALGSVNALSSAYFMPLVGVDDERAIAHISLFAAKERHVENGRLVLDDKAVPIDPDGRALINYIDPRALYIHRLTPPMLSQGLIAAGSSRVQEGDVVLIMPNITGNTNFVDTPYGRLSDLYMLAAEINSVMTGQWVRSWPWRESLTVLAILCGFFLNFIGSSTGFWSAFAGGLVAVCTVPITLFIYASVNLAFLFPVIGYAGCAVSLFAYRARAKDRQILELKLVAAEKLRLQREMDDAGEIARALLPRANPSFQRFEIDVFHQPLREASGDWYAFEASPSGRLLHLVMCDIVGHGVQGAIIASTCRTVLRLFANSDPAALDDKRFLLEYIQQLNGILYEQGAGLHMTTIAAITFAPDEHKMSILLAGHPRPIFLDASGKLKVSPHLHMHNPLGVHEHFVGEATQVDFSAGDQIIVFTDGLPLMPHASRLKRQLGEHWATALTSARELYEATWDHEKARTGRGPNDDISVVWLKHSA